MVPVSVIITAYNEDPQRLAHTLQSLQEGLRPEDEIVLIEDGCVHDLDPEFVEALHDSRDFTRYANKERKGIAYSRRLGYRLANHPWVIMTDGHMDYGAPYQFGCHLQSIKDPDPTTIYCHSMYDCNLKGDLIKTVRGAEFYWFRQLNGDAALGRLRLVDIQPLPWCNNPEPIEVAAPIGACYLAHKTWLEHIHYGVGLEMWGGCEQWLGVIGWMMGGHIRAFAHAITHYNTIELYQNAYRTKPDSIFLNKILVAWMVMDDSLFNQILNKMPRKQPAVTEGLMRFKKLVPELEPVRRIIQGGLLRSLDDFCERFDVEYPTTILIDL